MPADYLWNILGLKGKSIDLTRADQLSKSSYNKATPYNFEFTERLFTLKEVNLLNQLHDQVAIYENETLKAYEQRLIGLMRYKLYAKQRNKKVSKA